MKMIAIEIKCSRPFDPKEKKEHNIRNCVYIYIYVLSTTLTIISPLNFDD